MKKKIIYYLNIVFAFLLIIPYKGYCESKGKKGVIPEPQILNVPGYRDAAYYAPFGKKSRKPVFVYLHSMSGNPPRDCKRWYRVAIEYGWILCPSGLKDRGGGKLTWENNVPQAKKIVEVTLKALQEKYPGRVLLKRGVLAGFSEGAFIGLQLGIRMSNVFPHLLIIAADTRYIGSGDTEKLESLQRRLRVYLITGEFDSVIEESKRVLKIMRQKRITTKLKIVKGIGHEIPDNITALGWQAMRWLLKNKNYPMGSRR